MTNQLIASSLLRVTPQILTALKKQCISQGRLLKLCHVLIHDHFL